MQAALPYYSHALGILDMHLLGALLYTQLAHNMHNMHSMLFVLSEMCSQSNMRSMYQCNEKCQTQVRSVTVRNLLRNSGKLMVDEVRLKFMHRTPTGSKVRVLPISLPVIMTQ